MINEFVKSLLAQKLKCAGTLTGMLPEPLGGRVKEAGMDILSAVHEVTGELLKENGKAEDHHGKIDKIEIE